MRSQFRAFLDRDSEKGEQRAFHLPTGEEAPPRICDPSICKITACPQRNNVDQHGKECWYYTQKNKGAPLPHSVSPTSYSEGYTLAQQIEKVLQKALKPLHDRLEKLENEPDYHVQRSFNGTPQEPLPVGYPELFKLRKAKHD